MTDKKEMAIQLMFLFGFLIVFTVFTGIMFKSGSNRYSIYTGQVIATEYHQARLYPYTRIIMKTYSEDSITFYVNGNRPLQINGFYRIETQGKWFWAYPNIIRVELLPN
jgi:hypothetical protein